MGSPTVNDSRPAVGATFMLSATVRNDGDGAAAATTLRSYRSTDATITPADTAGHGTAANTSGSAPIVREWDVASRPRDRAWAVLHESIGWLLLGAAVRDRRDSC